ncbi:hypothetical protein ACV35D_33495, partial [Pseudomonas aeruginosa]
LAGIPGHVGEQRPRLAPQRRAGMPQLQRPPACRAYPRQQPATAGGYEAVAQPFQVDFRAHPLQLEHPGAALRRQARALLAGIPGHVGERELERVRQRLGWSDEERQLEVLAEDQGPGNALLLRIDCEHIC